MFYCKFQDKRARRLAESAIRDVIGKINYLLLESDEEGKRKVKEEVEKCAKDAKKVEEFVQNNKEKVEETLEKIDDEHKPLYKRAWDFLCYAVKKGVGFIFDHIFDILELIAILTIGFFCFPLLKKLWNYIEDALKKGEERKEELEVAKSQTKFQKELQKEFVPRFMDFLDDPEKVGEAWLREPDEDEPSKANEPRERMFNDDKVQFIKNLPAETKEKIKAWIMVNDLKGKKLVSTPISDFLGIGPWNAVRLGDHIAKAVRNAPTMRKLHRAQADANERQINQDVLPIGRVFSVINAIPRKKKDGSLDARAWKKLIGRIDAWDKAGRPTVIDDSHIVTRRATIDRDADPSIPKQNSAPKSEAPKQSFGDQFTFMPI